MRTDERTNRWVLGRKAERGKIFHGSFESGIRRCAELLIRECNAIVEVNEFFRQATIFCVFEGEPVSLQHINLDLILKEEARAKSSRRPAETTDNT